MTHRNIRVRSCISRVTNEKENCSASWSSSVVGCSCFYSVITNESNLRDQICPGVQIAFSFLRLAMTFLCNVTNCSIIKTTNLVRDEYINPTRLLRLCHPQKRTGEMLPTLRGKSSREGWNRL